MALKFILFIAAVLPNSAGSASSSILWRASVFYHFQYRPAPRLAYCFIPFALTLTKPGINSRP